MVRTDIAKCYRPLPEGGSERKAVAFFVVERSVAEKDSNFESAYLSSVARGRNLLTGRPDYIVTVSTVLRVPETYSGAYAILMRSDQCPSSLTNYPFLPLITITHWPKHRRPAIRVIKPFIKTPYQPRDQARPSLRPPFQARHEQTILIDSSGRPNNQYVSRQPTGLTRPLVPPWHRFTALSG